MLQDVTILGVGVSVPETKYSQESVLKIFEVDAPSLTSIFLNGGIETRHLILPKLDENNHVILETQEELLFKHKSYGIKIGSQAILNTLANANLKIEDIGYICCVTSTGFLTPGFSALLIKELGINPHCTRIDLVGMGCNAGLNGLNATSAWASQNPGQKALMVCIEICSATYVFDKTIQSAVVNSLFGDGAAAIVLEHSQALRNSISPKIKKFSSLIIPEAVNAMRFEWNSNYNKFNFYLDPNVPYVVGANAQRALMKLLENTGLRPSEIHHWFIHSGGKKVIDSVRINLGLSSHDARHTLSVLRDYGNISSGSFLFSLDRSINEDKFEKNDLGVMMTMGPGSTIEMALLKWQ